MLFSYTIEKEGPIHIIHMEGELIETGQAEELIQDIDELIFNNSIRFIIDMGALKYLNSSGLTILIRILTKARKTGGEAIVASVGKRIRELLLITQLNTVFTVTESIEEAREKLNKLVSN